MQLLLLLGLVAGTAAAPPLSLDLNGVWNFRSGDSQYTGTGVVPGDIYTDLFKAGLIDNPYKEDNDVKLNWIGRTDWIYENDFVLPPTYQQRRSLLLRFLGLDTVAAVLLNGNQIGTSNNQFRQLTIDIKNSVRAGTNNLTVVFSAPVNYSRSQADSFKAARGHEVPPQCPPNEQHGECQPNFIRKIQSSYSWDWGPSFPTSGIWQPAWLDAFDNAVFKQFTATVEGLNDQFNINFEITLFLASPLSSVDVIFKIDQVNSWETNVTLTANADGSYSGRFTTQIPTGSVNWWWPNGYGNQTLYATTAQVQFSDHQLTSRTINLGFRSIRLIQDFVNETNPDLGRYFYFEVNEVPIFLKGTNWIPVSSFPAQNNTARIDFLLDSAKEVGMNAMRVWGGGRYEDDHVYDKADQNGMLIWQDLMFACTMYPDTPEFLDNVRIEIQEQVDRIKFHASILVWAGNNENEVAITDGWYFAANFSKDEQIAEYLNLYKNTAKPVVQLQDNSRPFLLSSPSDGVHTEEQGGVATKPGDFLYGDVHFYDYVLDMWNDSTFPITRCTTEFGIQSLAFKQTYANYLDPSEIIFQSDPMLHRQHHGGGDLQMLTQVLQHFAQPPSGQFYTDRFIYLSQIHSALGIQSESEHYRRWRGRLNSEGKGSTMCALYWQLNDIWAAPTWASIDFDLRWKPLHYRARTFFAPVLVSIYRNTSRVLEAYVVSDLNLSLLGATVEFTVFGWGQSFTPASATNSTINVPGLASTPLQLPSDWLTPTLDDTDHSYRIRIWDQDQNLLAENILLPNIIKNVDSSKFGDVSISAVTPIDSNTFKIDLTATDVAPFVWIDIKSDTPGWLSDNAFTITEPTKSVTVKFYSAGGDATKATVCSLKTCGLS